MLLTSALRVVTVRNHHAGSAGGETDMAKRTSKAAPMAASASHFTDNGDGTVTDTRTGLMWAKATLACGAVDHAAATKACKALRLAGHKDWRMPTIEELFGLADRSRHSPAIDTDVFPNTESTWYWSSTPCAWDPSCAWVVGFFSGSAYGGHRHHNAFVRAVRSARPSQ